MVAFRLSHSMAMEITLSMFATSIMTSGGGGKD